MHSVPLKTKLEILQERINYFFKDETLLKTALSHRSINQNISNERLEFLGDRVLGLVISEYLYLNFSENEGVLAKKLNVFVCKKSCADAAQKIDLGHFLILASSEDEDGGRKRNTILGDACEALIAAIYLDSNFETAKKFVLFLWDDMLKAPITKIDAKSDLQEWSQSLGLGIPQYVILDKQGPDHSPIFTVQLTIHSHGDVTAKGHSRRQAETEAALIFLEQFKNSKQT